MAHHQIKPKVSNYEIIEHTADIGIKVKGSDLKELFKNTAVAMFDIMAEKQGLETAKRQKLEIEQKSDSLEELLINFMMGINR